MVLKIGDFPLSKLLDISDLKKNLQKKLEANGFEYSAPEFIK